MKLTNNEKKIESVYRKMMAEKTGEERMLMGFSMFDFSSRILLSSIKKNIPLNEQKKEIFLRLYRNDFSKEQQESILDRFSGSSPENALRKKLGIAGMVDSGNPGFAEKDEEYLEGREFGKD